MTLEERYGAADPSTSAGKARTLQEETVGAKPGVNFLDGEGVAPRAVPPNTYQNEFTRNAAGAFRYKATGQNLLGTGVDTTDKIEDVTPAKGLTRWTTTALKKAFLAGDSSLLTRFKTFRSKTYHAYTPLTNGSFFESQQLSPFAKERANPKSSGYGPGVTGLAG